MTVPTYDILGIGNAIVDVVARTDDQFLSRHDMHKGAMILVDSTAADAIYAAMPPGRESSGGSAANTCAVAAGLGARVAYVGKVADDQLGGVFRHDINAVGVHFPTVPLIGGAPTARCLLGITGLRVTEEHHIPKPDHARPVVLGQRILIELRERSRETLLHLSRQRRTSILPVDRDKLGQLICTLDHTSHGFGNQGTVRRMTRHLAHQ